MGGLHPARSASRERGLCIQGNGCASRGGVGTWGFRRKGGLHQGGGGGSASRRGGGSASRREGDLHPGG